MTSDPSVDKRFMGVAVVQWYWRVYNFTAQCNCIVVLGNSGNFGICAAGSEKLGVCAAGGGDLGICAAGGWNLGICAAGSGNFGICAAGSEDLVSSLQAAKI